MKKIKLIIAAGLTIFAVGGALASANKVTATYFYYPDNDPLNDPEQTVSEKICPIQATGCTTVPAGESGPRQLYIQTANGLRPVAPQPALK